MNAVKLLIDRGANLSVENGVGEMPLLGTIKNSPKIYVEHFTHNLFDDSLIKYMIDHGANVNLQNKFRFSPLHLAAIDNMESIVTVLLENGANIEIKDADERTPLMASARRSMSFQK